MAGTVLIAFEGLMFFHTEGDIGQVAIVDALRDGHQNPHVELWRSEDGGPDGDLELIGWYRLTKNNPVSFGTPGKVTQKGDGFYDAHVPKLRDHVIEGDGIASGVLGGRNHPGVLAYIDLPPGEITTWYRLLTPEVTLKMPNNKERKICFAKWVVLEPTNEVSRLSIRFEDAVKVKPNDLILVSNIGDPDHAGHVHEGDITTGHFELYDHLLTSDSTLGQSTFRTKALAGECKDEKGARYREKVEDKLEKRHDMNGIIILSPGGDCGPTGP